MEIKLILEYIQQFGLPVTIIGVLLWLIILIIKKLLGTIGKDTEWTFELKARSRHNDSRDDSNEEA